MTLPTDPLLGRDRRPRVLVLIVAYRAESTILAVLDRIPVMADFEVEVLMIDDGSTDGTFELAEERRRSHSYPYALRVLRNPVNQGYGGNQKLGYWYAIRNGFDLVVLLHGDGQYAPEMLPELLKPIAAGEAQVVLGSRFLSPHGAIKGGMPYYKFIGNRILTRYQNWVLGSRLSEFHTGYKAYSVEALRRIPFELNSNLFHFDTEIIIQLLRARCRFAEVAIPTHYGDEICRVPGLKYAKDVVVASTVARLQDYSLIYRRNFDVDPRPGAGRYESKVAFPSPHSIALSLIPPHSTVVDLGCGPGHLCLPLQAKAVRFIGVDRERPAGADRFDEFHLTELDGRLPRGLGEVDFVLLLDVLDHLPSPEKFCSALREAARDNSKLRVIISTGNVGFFVTRFMLLLGHFNYGKRGILDLTHTRLFTFGSLRRLLSECGYVVERVLPVPAPIPLVVRSKFRQRLLLGLNRGLMKISRRLFSYQCVMVARPLPTLETLLEQTIVSSRDRATV